MIKVSVNEALEKVRVFFKGILKKSEIHEEESKTENPESLAEEQITEQPEPLVEEPKTKKKKSAKALAKEKAEEERQLALELEKWREENEKKQKDVDRKKKSRFWGGAGIIVLVIFLGFLIWFISFKGEPEVTTDHVGTIGSGTVFDHIWKLRNLFLFGIPIVVLVTWFLTKTKNKARGKLKTLAVWRKGKRKRDYAYLICAVLLTIGIFLTAGGIGLLAMLGLTYLILRRTKRYKVGFKKFEQRPWLRIPFGLFKYFVMPAILFLLWELHKTGNLEVFFRDFGQLPWSEMRHALTSQVITYLKIVFFWWLWVVAWNWRWYGRVVWYIILGLIAFSAIKHAAPSGMVSGTAEMIPGFKVVSWGDSIPQNAKLLYSSEIQVTRDGKLWYEILGQKGKRYLVQTTGGAWSRTFEFYFARKKIPWSKEYRVSWYAGKYVYPADFSYRRKDIPVWQAPIGCPILATKNRWQTSGYTPAFKEGYETITLECVRPGLIVGKYNLSCETGMSAVLRKVPVLGFFFDKYRILYDGDTYMSDLQIKIWELPE